LICDLEETYAKVMNKTDSPRLVRGVGIELMETMAPKARGQRKFDPRICFTKAYLDSGEKRRR
jgi:hypothetical protein